MENQGVPMKIASKTRTSALLTSSIAIMMFSACAAQAQTTAASSEAGAGSDVIVVTARKRAESIVDVPLSIQAFSAEEIQKTGVRDLQELSRFTPSLFFVNGTQGNGARTISEVRFRGLASSIPTPTNQVGSVFVDGSFMLNGAQSLSFVDIERVEVIKGPQAAYFGRSTFAGAVNFVTRDPADSLKADVLLDYSPSFGSYNLAGSIEGPLSSTLSARLSASSQQRGSMFTATDGGKLGEEQTEAVSLTIVYKPSEAFKLKLRASYNQNNDSAPANTYLAFNKYGNCPPGTPKSVQTTGGLRQVTLARNFVCGDLPYDARFVDRGTSFKTLPALGNLPAVNIYDVLVNNSLKDPLLADAPRLDRFGLRSITYRFSGGFDYDIGGGFSLSGSGSYSRQRLNSIQDTDGTSVDSGFQAIPMSFEDASFEARMRYTNDSWLNATAGANYFLQNIQASTDTGVGITSQSQSGANVIRQVASSVTNQNDKVRTFGVFAGVDITPVDWFTFTAEGRYQIDKYTTFGGSNAANNLVESLLETKKFTPRLIASLTPMEDTTIYASYSYAFLPGTVNSRFLALTPTQQADVLAQLPGLPIVIAPEKLTNYEIGFKKAFPSINGFFSLAAFRMDWSNIKAGSAIIVPTLANPIFSVTLPGTARINGFELEAGISPVRQLSLRTTLGYLDAKYTDYANRASNAFFAGIPTADTFKADGNRTPRTPDWSVSGSVSWEDELTSTWQYRLRTDLTYTGRQFTDESNLTSISPYTIVNASVELFREDLSVRLYAKNLFDKGAWLTGRRFIDLSTLPLNFTTAGQGAFVSPIDRRELGIQIRKSF